MNADRINAGLSATSSASRRRAGPGAVAGGEHADDGADGKPGHGDIEEPLATRERVGDGMNQPCRSLHDRADQDRVLDRVTGVRNFPLASRSVKYSG